MTYESSLDLPSALRLFDLSTRFELVSFLSPERIWVRSGVEWDNTIDDALSRENPSVFRLYENESGGFA